MRHLVSVEVVQPRLYKFKCSCGVVLYNGPDSTVGETVENRHIRKYLGGYKAPPPTMHIDWDHIATWFLLTWIFSDD